MATVKKIEVKKSMKCGGTMKKAQNGGTAAVTSFVPKTKADSISANQMANYRNIRAMGNSKSSGSKEKGTLPASQESYDSLRAKQKGTKKAAKGAVIKKASPFGRSTTVIKKKK